MRSYNPLPEVIHLRCQKCGRRGRYSRARYVEIAGTDEPTSALLAFARAAGCEVALRQLPGQMDDRCGVGYDLDAG